MGTISSREQLIIGIMSFWILMFIGINLTGENLILSNTGNLNLNVNSANQGLLDWTNYFEFFFKVMTFQVTGMESWFIVLMDIMLIASIVAIISFIRG